MPNMLLGRSKSAHRGLALFALSMALAQTLASAAVASEHADEPAKPEDGGANSSTATTLDRVEVEGHYDNELGISDAASEGSGAPSHHAKARA